MCLKNDPPTLPKWWSRQLNKSTADQLNIWSSQWNNKIYYFHYILISYMTNFWHRSSGDLSDVLIDPAEDWSLSWWSRDHFRSRELTFNGFPRLNFEIAASGRPRIQILIFRISIFWDIDLSSRYVVENIFCIKWIE